MKCGTPILIAVVGLALWSAQRLTTARLEAQLVELRRRAALTSPQTSAHPQLEPGKPSAR